MKPIEDFKVSVYEVNNSSRNIPVPLINILRGIINGELKDKVNAIRRYMEEGDMKAANTLKASLPSFTVGGSVLWRPCRAQSGAGYQPYRS